MAAFPGKDKAEVGLGSRLASSLLAHHRSLFLVWDGGVLYILCKMLWLTRLPQAGQERKGKRREGEGKISRSLEYLRKRFQLSVSTTGFHSIWEILESLDTCYYPEAFL